MEHDLEPNIYIDDEKLYYSKSITSADGAYLLGIDNRTILTKEQFLACFKEWVTKDMIEEILQSKSK
jgi:hypothetical protein